MIEKLVDQLISSFCLFGADLVKSNQKLLYLIEMCRQSPMLGADSSLSIRQKSGTFRLESCLQPFVYFLMSIYIFEMLLQTLIKDRGFLNAFTTVLSCFIV